MKPLQRIILLFTILTAPAWAEVTGKAVEYQSGDTLMKGYLAWDDAIEGERPGILVVHEWWGHNEYARERARQLAALGYVALAVDMYGDGKQADHPDDAGKFATAVRENMPEAEQRFRAALHLLNEQPGVDPQRTGAIGYCFGGGVVLEMARRGVELDAVASFHGSIATANPAEPGMVKARILVANGAEDPMVTSDQIAVFEAEMQAVGVDYTFINYEGAQHSFTNPAADEFGQRFNMPLAYNPEADQASWAAMVEMFGEVFGQ